MATRTISPPDTGVHPPGEEASRQVIARAAAVLRTLEREPDGLNISQVARACDLPRTTVQRMVLSLQAEQFVAVADGRVRLGPALARLAAAAHLNVSQQIRPHLEKLARATGETVDLWVARGADAVLVDEVASSREIRVVCAPGVEFPMGTTASGKALLAALPDDAVRAAMRGRLIARTPRSITRMEVLLAELATVRTTGLAYDLEEHADDVCAVGVALRLGGAERYAIAVPAPARRFQASKDALSQALLRCRDAIERGESAD
ncbi:IclR family transcriptional regulator [soil metagenome]